MPAELALGNSNGRKEARGVIVMIEEAGCRKGRNSLMLG